LEIRLAINRGGISVGRAGGDAVVSNFHVTGGHIIPHHHGLVINPGTSIPAGQFVGFTLKEISELFQPRKLESDGEFKLKAPAPTGVKEIEK
jgi:hypothetical protein